MVKLVNSKIHHGKSAIKMFYGVVSFSITRHKTDQEFCHFAYFSLSVGIWIKNPRMKRGKQKSEADFAD